MQVVVMISLNKVRRRKEHLKEKVEKKTKLLVVLLSSQKEYLTENHKRKGRRNRTKL